MENIFPRICFSLRIKHFLQIKKFSPRKKKKSLRLKFKRKIIETVFCINIQIFIGGQNQPLYNWYQLQRKIKRVYMHGLCCIWTFNFGHGTISRLMGETVTQDVCQIYEKILEAGAHWIRYELYVPVQRPQTTHRRIYNARNRPPN